MGVIVSFSKHALQRIAQRCRSDNVVELVMSILEQGQWYAKPPQNGDHKYLVCHDKHYFVIVTRDGQKFKVITYVQHGPQGWLPIIAEITPNTPKQQYIIHCDSRRVLEGIDHVGCLGYYERDWRGE
jgi:hypothetical protein